jgi:hypothetical protein
MAERIAQLQVAKGVGNRSLVTVQVPTKITAKEFGALQKTLIDKVIKDLTGCACLSGAVDVIFREDLEQVIRVNL